MIKIVNKIIHHGKKLFCLSQNNFYLMHTSVAVYWKYFVIPRNSIGKDNGFSVFNMLGIPDYDMIIRSPEISRHFRFLPFCRKAGTDSQTIIVPFYPHYPLIQPHQAPSGCSRCPGLIRFPVISWIRGITVRKYIRLCS